MSEKITQEDTFPNVEDINTTEKIQFEANESILNFDDKSINESQISPEDTQKLEEISNIIKEQIDDTENKEAYTQNNEAPKTVEASSEIVEKKPDNKDEKKEDEPKNENSFLLKAFAPFSLGFTFLRKIDSFYENIKNFFTGKKPDTKK